jgi:hypothetical protein
MSEFLEVSKELGNRGNPKFVKKICEWTGDEFWVGWKYRNARFKDTQSMQEWRKSRSREVVKCLNCGNEFERYKSHVHHRSGLPTQYCSNYCSVTSDEKKEKLKKWANSDNNHWKHSNSQQKVRQTKLERYGDENYNNMDKCIETNMKLHGVPYSVYLDHAKSNGKRISKGHYKLFESVKNDYSDAIIEHYLTDVNIMVDIFIPSCNMVVEFFGDYWHCNPLKYDETYYHTQVHKTAKEIWEYDRKRVDKLKSAGYSVKIVWEYDF